MIGELFCSWEWWTTRRRKTSNDCIDDESVGGAKSYAKEDADDIDFQLFSASFGKSWNNPLDFWKLWRKYTTRYVFYISFRFAKFCELFFFDFEENEKRYFSDLMDSFFKCIMHNILYLEKEKFSFFLFWKI